MKGSWYCLSIFVLCFLFIQDAFCADPNWRIHIKEDVILSSAKVYLKDIAFIVGDKNNEKHLALLNTLLWEESSSFGVVYSIGKMKLQRILREKLKEKERFCIYPPTLRYQRGGYIITEEEIRKKVKDAFIPQLQKKYKGDIEITDFILPKNIFLSNTSEKLHILNKALAPGKVSFILEILSSTGTPLKRYQASAFVNIYTEVLCATKDIRKGETVQISVNVDFCKKNSSIVSNSIVKEKAIENMKARVGILKGNAVLSADLEKIPAIKKGSIVLLEYKNASLFLVIEVEALKDGYIGEYIPVRNMQSKKNVTALIKDINKVVITR